MSVVVLLVVSVILYTTMQIREHKCRQDRLQQCSCSFWRICDFIHNYGNTFPTSVFINASRIDCSKTISFPCLLLFFLLHLSGVVILYTTMEIRFRPRVIVVSINASRIDCSKNYFILVSAVVLCAAYVLRCDFVHDYGNTFPTSGHCRVHKCIQD